MRVFGFAFFTSATWNPVTHKYGALAPVCGTVITSLIAVGIAAPLGSQVAYFLTQVCWRKVREPVAIAIESLAMIPSIAYGMIGVFFIQPILDAWFSWIADQCDGIPILQTIFAGPVYGGNILIASLILALMILPYIAAGLRDLLDEAATPHPIRNPTAESAYGMGATTYEVVKYIAGPRIRAAKRGLILLGLGRALGETMAVTYVIGGSYHIGWSLFGQGISISSAIALNFGDAQPGSLRLSTFFALAFILLCSSGVSIATGELLVRLKNGGNASRGQSRSYWYRRLRNRMATVLSTCCAAAVLSLLAVILSYLIVEGCEGLSTGSWSILIPAIFGTLEMVGVATVLTAMLGALAGVFLGTYAKALRSDRVCFMQDTWYRNSIARLGGGLRFLNKILISTPSIIVGVCVYELMVLTMGGFSGLAGVISLTIIGTPIVVSTTVDALDLVPDELLAATMAFSGRKLPTIWIACRYASRAIATGILLAVARMAGETAPLLYTSFGNPDTSFSLLKPMATLPAVAYARSQMPDPESVASAWAGLLILSMVVLSFNLLVRMSAARSRAAH